MFFRGGGEGRSLEEGIHRGDHAAYVPDHSTMDSGWAPQPRALSIRRLATNLPTRRKRRGSKDHEVENQSMPKSKWQLVPWTAVVGVIMMIIGLLMFVISGSFGHHYSRMIFNGLQSSFSSKKLFSALFIAAQVVSGVFVILSIVSIYVLFKQEMKMEWRRLGMVKGSDNMHEIPGLRGWTSKRMLQFIIGLSFVFTLAASWFLVTIVGASTLVIVYNELEISTSPYNITESYPAAALDAGVIEREVDALIVEFQNTLNASQFNLEEVERILCPAISCVDFSSISYVATEECVCDPATLESVSNWAHEAKSCYIAALVAACLMFLSASALGLRCMIAGATIRVRLQHWEYMQPVLVASEGRPIDQRHERTRSQSSDLGGLRPQKPKFVQTPEGVIVGDGGLDVEKMHVDFERLFPTTEQEDIIQHMPSEKGRARAHIDDGVDHEIERGLDDDEDTVESDPVVEYESRHSGYSKMQSSTMSASVSMNNIGDIVSEGTSSSIAHIPGQVDFQFDHHIQEDSLKGEGSRNNVRLLNMEKSVMDGTTKREASLYQSRRGDVMNDMVVSKALFTSKEDMAKKKNNTRRTIVHAYESNASPLKTIVHSWKNSVTSIQGLTEEIDDTSDGTNSTGKSNHYNPFLRWEKGGSDSSED
mmetsp:Transcript_2074/g.4284  ORF Transcript_2074/g.4284 Transcript_2074/m.4284 type:complete len:649 (-) Transcript_2074:66-2012(-)